MEEVERVGLGGKALQRAHRAGSFMLGERGCSLATMTNSPRRDKNGL